MSAKIIFSYNFVLYNILHAGRPKGKKMCKIQLTGQLVSTLLHFPLQQTNPLLPTLHFSKHVDCYLNGQLQSTYILKGLPNTNDQEIELCQNGGFYGVFKSLIVINDKYLQ